MEASLQEMVANLQDWISLRMKFEEWLETVPHEMGKYELAKAAFDAAASQKKAIDESDEYEEVDGGGC